jgi:cyclopropane-fatty-acyl-phospholipid synthase
MSGLIELAERGWLPDHAIRAGIRHLVRRRLHEEQALANDAYGERMQQLRESAIALSTDAANEQHYEVPARFFELALGANLKYSSGYWHDDESSLDSAEEAMLELYARRAGIGPGQVVLDLGCGWGSFTLWAAARHPDATFVAVSNSRSQRAFIEARALERGLTNVTVLTADVNALEFDPGRFDCVVSVEMFEHVRNYEVLLGRIARRLKPRGRMFVHIFCHRSLLYPFQSEGDANWMGRHFFTGGLMPAADTLLHFQRHLELEQRWLLAGTHYQRTARAWLHNLDANDDAVRAVFEEVYGTDGERWVQRWRMFFMACEEMFGYDQGRQWLVCHYRFAARQ